MSERLGPSVVTAVVRPFRSGPAPVNLTALGVAAVALSISVPAGIAFHAPFLAAFPALFLSLFISGGSMRVALLSWLIHSAAILAVVVMAVVFANNLWWAALGMAAIGFFGSVVQTLSSIGMTLGLITGILYIIYTGEGLTRGTNLGVAMLATVTGLVGVAIGLIVARIRDPGGPFRRSLAEAIEPDSPIRALGQVAATENLERTRSESLALAGKAAGLKVARQVALTDTECTPTIAQLDARTREIAAALRPRGPLVPRRVAEDLDSDADLGLLKRAPDQATPGRVGVCFMWRYLSDMRDLLTGVIEPSGSGGHERGDAIRRQFREGLKPHSRWFRYGIQRAVGLGVAMLVFEWSWDGDRNGFWMLLGAFAVMQPHARTTTRKAAVRVLGTLVGAGLAVAVAWLIPDQILFPWGAGLLLICGLSLMQRNPTMLIVLTTAGAVLLVGVPSSAVPVWAGHRLLDMAVGGVWAALVAGVLLPWRPDPQVLIDTVRAKAFELLAAVRRNVVEHRPSESLVATALDYDLAIMDAEASIEVLREPDRSRLREQLNSAGAVLDNLRGVSLLSGGPIDARAIAQELDRIDGEIQNLRVVR